MVCEELEVLAQQETPLWGSLFNQGARIEDMTPGVGD